MNEELINQISDRETRIAEAVEFFGWPRDLVEKMFEHSKEYFEGVWERYYPAFVDEYYASGYYMIRQLSYSADQIFGEKVRRFLSMIDGSCVDIACGVGDYAIYLAKQGIDVSVVEHYGIPTSFLMWRFDRWGVKIPVSNDPLILGRRDYTMLISAIDHIKNPCEIVQRVCSMTNKKVFATPCIDENYDRPTHIKSILRDVPAAFAMIKEHNAKH